MSDAVRWPSGYEDLIYKLRVHAAKITGGTLIALDPSSGSKGSMPGYAIFEAGLLVFSGEIKLPYQRPVYERLQLLHKAVLALTPEPPDVFVIEEIKGQNFGSRYLNWSVGTAISAARTPTIIECPINLWKALAKVTPDYVKGDAEDAVMIGRSVILRTQGLTEKKG